MNLKIYHYRVTDKPASELSIITHGRTLAKVRQGLINRYGSRLISVYES